MFEICRPAVSKGVGPACGAVPRSENDFSLRAPQSDGEKPAWLGFPRGDTDSYFGVVRNDRRSSPYPCLVDFRLTFTRSQCADLPLAMRRAAKLSRIAAFLTN